MLRGHTQTRGRGRAGTTRTDRIITANTDDAFSAMTERKGRADDWNRVPGRFIFDFVPKFKTYRDSISGRRLEPQKEPRKVYNDERQKRVLNK